MASCLPLLLQIPVFFALFYVLKDFEKEVFPNYPDSELGWLGIVPNITENINAHWSGYLLLVIYVGSQLVSTFFMSTTMDPRQRYHLPGAAVPLHLLRHQLPDRADALLVDDQPLDGRPGPRHAPPRARSPSLRRSAPRERHRSRSLRLRSGAAAAPATATPAQTSDQAGRQRPAARPPPQEEGPASPTMTEPASNPDDGVVESRGRDRRRGEVDGAPRARAPLPRARQGERSLHGSLRGRARPARRRPGSGAGDRPASTKAPQPVARRRAEEPGSPAAKLRELLEQVCRHSARRAGSTSPRTTRSSTRPDRPRSRSRHRQARPDDRRDPVPRQRDPLARRRRRPQGRRRRRSRAIATAGASSLEDLADRAASDAVATRPPGRARAHDRGRAEDRAPPPEGAGGRRDLERGDRAEPARRRRSRAAPSDATTRGSSAGSRRSSPSPA